MNQYMELAKTLSENCFTTNEGGPFGACVVKDGIVIGKGFNQVLGHHDPTAHAEIMAIRDACTNMHTHDLTGCELYTSCYPCPMCLSAIIWSNIKKVYYGNTKEDAARIGFRDASIYSYIQNTMDHCEDKEVLELKCIDRDETIKTFDQFMEKNDKTMY